DKSFATKDGYIEISPVFTENALRDISLALGLDDFSQRPLFRTHELQLQNRAALNAALAERFREKTTAEWLQDLEPKGVLCARINTLAEAAEDEQLRANAMLVEMEHAR